MSRVLEALLFQILAPPMKLPRQQLLLFGQRLIAMYLVGHIHGMRSGEIQEIQTGKLLRGILLMIRTGMP